MLQCLNCRNDFSPTIVIDGVRRNLSGRKYCLECSPFGKKNSSKKHFAGNYCLFCGKETKGTNKYCSKICSRKQTIYKKRLEFKHKAILYKGGKCQLCGYDKDCPAAYDFHHVNPEEKEFKIAQDGITNSWDVMQKELDKCILLCATCHREVESGFSTVSLG